MPVLVLLGLPGSFSDLASKKFEKKFKKKYVNSFEKLFKIVNEGENRRGGGTYGFLPVKNKIVGVVQPCETLLKGGRYHVSERLRFSVKFVIAAKSEQGQIRTIYCPLVAYDQCKKFISTQYPHAKIITNFHSTSMSFKKVFGQKGVTSAGIGSMQAAKIFKLKVLAKNIQDDPGDWTEFVLFRK